VCVAGIAPCPVHADIVHGPSACPVVATDGTVQAQMARLGKAWAGWAGRSGCTEESRVGGGTDRTRWWLSGCDGSRCTRPWADGSGHPSPPIAALAHGAWCTDCSAAVHRCRNTSCLPWGGERSVPQPSTGYQTLGWVLSVLRRVGSLAGPSFSVRHSRSFGCISIAFSWCPATGLAWSSPVDP